MGWVLGVRPWPLVLVLVLVKVFSLRRWVEEGQRVSHFRRYLFQNGSSRRYGRVSVFYQKTNQSSLPRDLCCLELRADRLHAVKLWR